MGKILTVYFTRSGSSEKAANKLSELLGTGVEKLADKKSYKGPFGALRGCYMALFGRETEIEAPKHNPADFDKIVLVTPIWAGKMTPAIYTYVKKYKDILKPKLSLVTCSGSPSQSDGAIKALDGFGITPMEAVALDKADWEGDTYIEKLRAISPVDKAVDEAVDESSSEAVSEDAAEVVDEGTVEAVDDDSDEVADETTGEAVNEGEAEVIAEAPDEAAAEETEE